MMIRSFGLALFAVFVTVGSSGFAGDIDRTVADFKTPAEIKWVRNAAETNESAVLFGDPSKPGPYVQRTKWFPSNMSRPHFHPNDRFFIVISDTWWMGTGDFDAGGKALTGQLGGICKDSSFESAELIGQLSRSRIYTQSWRETDWSNPNRISNGIRRST